MKTTRFASVSATVMCSGGRHHNSNQKYDDPGNAYRKVPLFADPNKMRTLAVAWQRFALSAEYHHRLAYVLNSDEHPVFKASLPKETVFPNETWRRRLQVVFEGTPFSNAGSLRQFLVFYGAQTAILALWHHPVPFRDGVVVPLGKPIGPLKGHHDMETTHNILRWWLTKDFLPLLQSFFKPRGSSSSGVRPKDNGVVSSQDDWIIVAEQCCIIQYTLLVIAASFLAEAQGVSAHQPFGGYHLIFWDILESSAVLTDMVHRIGKASSIRWNCKEICDAVGIECKELLEPLVRPDEESQKTMKGQLKIAHLLREHWTSSNGSMPEVLDSSSLGNENVASSLENEDASILFMHHHLSNIGRSALKQR